MKDHYWQHRNDWQPSLPCVAAHALNKLDLEFTERTGRKALNSSKQNIIYRGSPVVYRERRTFHIAEQGQLSVQRCNRSFSAEEQAKDLQNGGSVCDPETFIESPQRYSARGHRRFQRLAIYMYVSDLGMYTVFRIADDNNTSNEDSDTANKDSKLLVTWNLSRPA